VSSERIIDIIEVIEDAIEEARKAKDGRLVLGSVQSVANLVGLHPVYVRKLIYRDRAEEHDNPNEIAFPVYGWLEDLEVKGWTTNRLHPGVGLESTADGVQAQLGIKRCQDGAHKNLRRIDRKTATKMKRLANGARKALAQPV